MHPASRPDRSPDGRGQLRFKRAALCALGVIALNLGSADAARPAEAPQEVISRVDPSEQVGEPNGQPQVILFVLGPLCPHCMSQLLTFATDPSLRRLQVTVVSADRETDVRKFRDIPFKLVADPKHKLFRKFGAYEGKPMHATLVMDGKGEVVFRRVGASPYMDATTVALWAWVAESTAAAAIPAAQETR